jgi:hypothetical protein
MSEQKSTTRGGFAWSWILLDRIEFHDSFALLKWKIESVTLAPLLTPEDTKSRDSKQFVGQLFHARGKAVNISPFYIEVVLHG